MIHLLAVLALAVTPAAASAATITVDANDDAAANDGRCTLREAMTAAQTDAASGAAAGECAAGSGADTINFSVLGTIDVAAQLPVITTDLIIRGPGARNLAIDAGGRSRLFVINGGTTRMEGLTLRRALILAPDANGNPVGAAILNRGRVDVVNVVFTENRSVAQGGAVYNEGIFTTDSATFSGNTADQGGGSALFTFGNVVMVNSTVSGNSAGSGSGALAGDGSGARLGLSFVTVTANGGAGAEGGGVLFPGGPIDFLANSIVAGNAGAQCFRAPSSNNGGNVATDGTCGAGTRVGDPRLQPLALNGGSTPTHALGDGSAAIDIGTFSVGNNEAGCSSTVFKAGAENRDQRGVARPQGAACDAGAYELAPRAAGASQCGNGADDDRDGFTDGEDPDCKAGRGVEDTVNNPVVACTSRDLVLVDVVQSGRNVRFQGLADPALAGAVVEIVSRGRVVQRAAIGKDGVFRGSARAPSQTVARTARYLARLGRERSLNLKLQRRTVVRSLRTSGGKVVMTGVVSGAGGRRATVELLARRGDCKARYTRIGRARLDSSGRFRVTADAPRGVTIAIFRARVSLGGGRRTFTLPRPLRLR